MSLQPLSIEAVCFPGSFAWMPAFSLFWEHKTTCALCEGGTYAWNA